MTLTLNDIAARAKKIAADKGFHDTERELERILEESPALLQEEKSLQTARRLALIHSEVSEALEACRRGKYADMAAFKAAGATKEAFEKHVKDTFEDELADAIIRLTELAAIEGIDLEAHIRAKMDYNERRPYKFAKAY